MTGRAQRGVFVALLAASVLLRVVDLHWVPGVNGDEAWYGVQAQDFHAGRGLSLVTPTHNWQNPFFLLPTLLVAVLPPSFLMLRLIAVAAGLVTVLLAWRFVRRDLDGDESLGIAATLLVATLPIHVGYSRFAWDTCETSLASLVAFHFALRGNWWPLAAAFFALVWVHPLNVFSIVPLAFTGLGALAMQPVSPDRRAGFVRALTAGLAALLACKVALLPRSAALDAAAAADNLVSAQGWWRFAVDYAHLLDGVTLYRYIVGEPAAWVVSAHDAVFALVVAAAFATGLPAMLRAGDLRLLGLVTGTVVGAGVYHVALGAMPLEPGHERYAMGLVAPALLTLLALLRHARWPAVAVPALAAAMLASFASNYTLPLRSEGSRSHRTFHSAPDEPKAAALRAVLAAAPPGEAVTIYAEDWWLYWPMRYLASRDDRVTFEYHPRGELDEDKVRAMAAAGAWVVGFEGGPVQAALPRLFPGDDPVDVVVRDVAGRPLVHVWHQP